MMSPFKYVCAFLYTLHFFLICWQVSSSNVDRNRVALHSILYTVSANQLFVEKTTTSSKMLRSIYFRNITAAPIRVALCPEVTGTITIHVPKQFAQTAVQDDSAPSCEASHADNSVKASEKSSVNRPFGSISSIFVGNERRRSSSKHGPTTSPNDEQQLARLQSQLDLATPPSKLGREKKDSTNLQVFSQTFQDSPIKRPVRRRTSTLANIDPAALKEQGVQLGLMPEDKLLAPSQAKIDGSQNLTSPGQELERLLAIYDGIHPSMDPPHFKSYEQERFFVLDKMASLRKCETLLASSCTQVNDIVLHPGVDVPVILGISAENWYNSQNSFLSLTQELINLQWR
jgi:hypothetical protein